MGLDGVELIMEVEVRFGINLPDAQCQYLRTVADLAALVIAQQPTLPRGCPTASSFYHLRAIFTTHAGLEKRSIRPSTHLENLFPRNRRRVWSRLRTHDPRLPRLIASPAMEKLFPDAALAVMLAWCAAVVLIIIVHNAYAAAASAAISLGALIPAIMGANARLRRHFPPQLQTVGDMVRSLAPTYIPADSSGARLIAEQRVLELVRSITSSQLGVPFDEVKPESEFVKDLGMD